MDTIYLTHLNRLLSLLEEDANDIRQVIKDDLLALTPLSCKKKSRRQKRRFNVKKNIKGEN